MELASRGLVIVTVIVVALHESCGANVGDERVKLVNNGYVGVLVAVAEGMDEANKVTLIDNVKEVVKQGSGALFKGTLKRAYFKEVTILLPHHWDLSSYTLSPYNSEHFSTANIIVDHANKAYKDQPYVKLGGDCGEPGDYVHLATEYLLGDINKYGDIGKVMVHEWGHLRWGLRDEYVQYGIPDDRFRRFYINGNGYADATRCGKYIKGDWDPRTDCSIDPATMLPRDTCNWKPNVLSQDKASVSVMYYHFLPNVDGFCDNDPGNTQTLHNDEAPHPQNVICGGRSAWELMRQHRDFSYGANPPAASSTPPAPIIRLVQARPVRFVLVLDVSGSMGSDISSVSSYSKIDRLYQHAKLFLEEAVPRGAYVGIVTFETTARLKSQLIQVSGNDSVQTLVAHLPRNTGGNTCIGCGLNEAIGVLENFASSQNARGGHILLISDGEENVDPRIADVTPNITAKGVSVHSILYSDQADPNMEALSLNTGGQAFFDRGQGNSTDLLADLISIVETIAASQLSTNNAAFSPKVQLALEGYSIGPNSMRNISVFLDSSIGENTTLSFAYQHTGSPSFEVEVYSPSGKIHSSSDASITTVDDAARTMKIQIPGVAEAGEWTVQIKTQSASEHIQLLVTSMGRPGQDQIQLKTSFKYKNIDFNGVSSLYQLIQATLTQGGAPVINAQVVATVDSDTGQSESLSLKDTGVGADIVANDGIYSRYYVQYKGNGRYRVKVIVESVPGRTKVMVGLAGVYNPAFVSTSMTDPGPQYNDVSYISRFSSAGFFTVANQTNDTDVFPPSKVRDLKVTSVDTDRKIVHLEWTAPGDDLDVGTASKYDLRYCQNASQAYNDFASCTSISASQVTGANLLSPKVAYSKETASWQVPSSVNTERPLALVLRTSDDVGLQSDVSNVAMAAFVIQSLETTTQVQPTVPSQDVPASFILSIAVPIITLGIVLSGLFAIWVRYWNGKRLLRKAKRKLKHRFERRRPARLPLREVIVDNRYPYDQSYYTEDPRYRRSRSHERYGGRSRSPERYDRWSRSPERYDGRSRSPERYDRWSRSPERYGRRSRSPERYRSRSLERFDRRDPHNRSRSPRRRMDWDYYGYSDYSPRDYSYTNPQAYRGGYEPYRGFYGRPY